VWQGKPGATFTFYQWYRCPESSTAEDTFVGCTGVDNRHSYTVTEADLGMKIRVRVVAANSVNVGHGVSHTSLPTEAVQADAGPPAEYAGGASLDNMTPGVGDTVTLNPGEWTGAPHFQYDWMVCDSYPESDVPNWETCDQQESIGNSYTVKEADLGRIIVGTAITGNAASSASSAHVGAPALSGGSLTISSQQPSVGDTLTVDDSTEWSHGSTSVSYEWQACDGPEDVYCQPTGGTGSSWQVEAPYAGRLLRVKAVAHNANGDSAPVYSPVTGAVAGGATWVGPYDMVLSNMGPAVGDTISVDEGTWNHNGTLSFSYQWQRCSLVENPEYPGQMTCSDIPGATDKQYVATADDADMFLQVKVTGYDNGIPGEMHLSDPTQPVRVP
jgi:hypothetical protein